MSTLIVFLLIALPAFGTGLVMRSLKAKHSKYVNPLTKSLRRPPGAELGRELATEQLEAGFGAAEVALYGMIPAVAYLAVWQSESIITKLLVMTPAILASTFFWLRAFRKLIARFNNIRVLRLGYECELAVGQELDLLMLRGYRVFHDLPADNFNIDHVVVGPTGVYAVETKGRSKRVADSEDKAVSYRVSYAAGKLYFPFGTDTKIVPQATRQAKWLSNWLSSATGMSVEASPIVVLPGWFVESKDRPAVPVIASGYIDGYFKRQSGKALCEEAVARIVHQLDSRVRDLKPGELVAPKPSAGAS